jgi:hypothetical protein
MRNDEYFIHGGAHQPSHACAPRPPPTMTSIQANCADGAANEELFTSCVRAWNFLLSVLMLLALLFDGLVLLLRNNLIGDGKFGRNNEN